MHDILIIITSGVQRSFSSQKHYRWNEMFYYGRMMNEELVM
jgi:hypothetical protein